MRWRNGRVIRRVIPVRGRRRRMSRGRRSRCFSRCGRVKYPRMITATAAITVDAVLAKLRAMERGFAMRWLMLALAGAFVCMIGPVIFGSALWLRQFNTHRSDNFDPQPWLHVVMMTAAWFLPIL